MTKEVEFLIYCIEEYKRRHGLNGKAAFSLFESTRAKQYIIDHYEALHTAGVEYTLADIDGLLTQVIHQ